MKSIRSYRHVACLLIVVLVSSLASPALGAGKISPKRRAAVRAARMEALGALDGRLAAHLEKLEALLVEWFAAGVELPDDFKAEFEQLLGAARKLGSEKLRGSNEEVLARLPAGKDASATSPASLQRRFKDHRKELTKKLLDDGKTALKLDSGVRLYLIASAVRCLLAGNTVLAKALGKRKYRDEWLDPTECDYLKKGYVWDEEFGWIRRGERSRYLAGEYFEVGGRKWTTLDEADRVHFEVDTPWDIETEHFHLQGTAKLTDLLALTDVLMANRMRMLAVVSPLLDEKTKAAKERALLTIGERRHSRFRIYLHRTRAQFEGSSADNADSLGYYSPAENCTFLSQEIDSEDSDVLDTARHEAFHQTFTEVLLFHSPTGPATGGFPMWAEEGLAEYFCYVDDRSDRFIEFLKSKPEGLGDLVKKTFLARSVDEWNALDSSTKSECYVVAEMLVIFLLEGRSGLYEADFYAFLTESTKKHNRPLDALGLSHEEFTKEIQAWIEGLEGPK